MCLRDLCFERATRGRTPTSVLGHPKVIWGCGPLGPGSAKLRLVWWPQEGTPSYSGLHRSKQYKRKQGLFYHILRT